MSKTDRIVGEAAAWHAASENDTMDWDGFTAWLEADPRHRAAYDEVALADSLVADHRVALRESEAEPQSAAPASWFTGRWKWAGGAIAAALALIFLVQGWPGSHYTTYQTEDASRRIALSDGSSITLAPHSNLVVSSGQQELALSGGAWFDIRHQQGRELAISAGPVQVRDIGTKFDIQSDPGMVRLGVAEGKVEVASVAFAEPVQLEAGKRMQFDVAAGKAVLSSTPVSSVGSWRNGRLTFDAAPLSLVAADLSRYAGVEIQLPDSLKGRRFSGTLASSDGKAAIRDLAQLMGLELVPAGSGYRLEPRPR